MTYLYLDVNINVSDETSVYDASGNLRVGVLLALAACSQTAASEARAPADAGSAAGALAVVGVERAAATDPASLAVLHQGLSSPDYATRLVATEALGCAHGPDVMAWLSFQLGDAEPDVRAAAIAALHQRTSPEATAQLRSVRDDETELLFLRVLAAHALVTPSASCTRKD